jgi:predicted esterase
MSRSSQPSPFIVQPSTGHTQTFILLHGLGSNGENFGIEFLETARTSNGQKLTEIFPGARFIFPTAKKRRSSAFCRAKINQWFDIASLDNPSFKRETQYDGLADSANYLLQLIKDEMELIKPQHIILGGLSHGCAMALSLNLCLDIALGGVIGMSGWLPFERDITDILNSPSDPTKVETTHGDLFSMPEVGGASIEGNTVVEALQFQRDLLSIQCDDIDKIKTPLSTPVFIGHGQADEKIKVSLGEDIMCTLQSLGVCVTWRQYQDHGHWYKIPDEIDDIVGFIVTKTSFVSDL